MAQAKKSRMSNFEPNQKLGLTSSKRQVKVRLRMVSYVVANFLIQRAATISCYDGGDLGTN